MVEIAPAAGLPDRIEFNPGGLAVLFAPADLVIPAILKDRPAGEGRPIRVWVPGCASGEEAVAAVTMTIVEQMGPAGIVLPGRQDDAAASMREAQSAQHRLADAYVDIECMRSVVIEAACGVALR